MANQKEIRTRIQSVKNTQKITRAMKMVAGARLNRAQSRIFEMRPYAVETSRVLRSVVGQPVTRGEEVNPSVSTDHPLLSVRDTKRVALLVLTSDRGLCGAFNSSLLRQASNTWHKLEEEGKEVSIYVVGRKGRDYFARRNAPVVKYFDGLWEDLGLEQAQRVAKELLAPYSSGQLDQILVLYNEFKSAMTQIAKEDTLFPLTIPADQEERAAETGSMTEPTEFIFEPDRKSLLDVLVPMYIEITLLRSLYESMASELGARMTAMDSATKNAKDMISALTLQYNRARQAAITTELMEIIGGAEALNA